MKEIATLVSIACKCKLERNEDDGWLKATLLVAAFQTEDPKKVRSLVGQMLRENPAEWQLKTTSTDNEKSLEPISNKDVQIEYDIMVDELKNIIDNPA